MYFYVFYVFMYFSITHPSTPSPKGEGGQKKLGGFISPPFSPG